MSPVHNAVANLNRAETAGDAVVSDFGAEGIKADVIAECTAATGVTIDSVECKDGKVTASGDTAAGDNATLGYTTTEGAILTGQGSTSDITLKNDADGTVLTVATGQTAIARVGGDQTLAISLANANTTILEANSGKVHLIPNVSADRIYTLPPNAAGLYYEFWSTLVAADGHDVQIVADNAADFYKGTLFWLDTNASPTVWALLNPNGTDDHTLNLILPIAFYIKMYCDGTNWFITGNVYADATPTWT